MFFTFSSSSLVILGPASFLTCILLSLQTIDVQLALILLRTLITMLVTSTPPAPPLFSRAMEPSYVLSNIPLFTLFARHPFASCFAFPFTTDHPLLHHLHTPFHYCSHPTSQDCLLTYLCLPFSTFFLLLKDPITLSFEHPIFLPSFLRHFMTLYLTFIPHSPTSFIQISAIFNFAPYYDSFWLPTYLFTVFI